MSKLLSKLFVLAAVPFTLLLFFVAPMAWAFSDLEVAQTDSIITSQDAGSTLFFVHPKGKSYFARIHVQDVTSGTAYYSGSENAGVLTLVDVSASSVSINGRYYSGDRYVDLPKSLTIELVGSSYLSSGINYHGSQIETLKIDGEGTLGIGSSSVGSPSFGIHFTHDDGLNSHASSAVRKFIIMGGSVSIDSPQFGVSLTNCDMSVLGGNLSVKNPTEDGVYLNNGSLKMSHGSLQVLNAGHYGVWSWSKGAGYYPSGWHGGSITISSTFTSTVKKPNENYAVSCERISFANKAMKRVIGRMPSGLTFVQNGNKYMTDGNGVHLLKYGAKSTKVNLKPVKYFGSNYPVFWIGSKAFNNAAGRKVKSVSCTSNYLYGIGSKAFYGMNNLTSLTFYPATTALNGVKAKKAKSVALTKSASFAKGCLSKCGKGNGKKFVVTVYDKYGFSQKKGVELYKSFLMKYGMANKAKVKMAKARF